MNIGTKTLSFCAKSLPRLLLFCVFALTLVSCIDVDDFGATWNKSFLDPDLAGHWRKVSDDPVDISHMWIFNDRDGAYEVQLYTDNKADDDGPMYPLKTLAVGKYLFLANGPQKGTMIRYKVVDGRINWYKLDFEKAWAFIQEKYPDQKNIVHEDSPDGPVKINTFDDEVFKIVAAIPDNDIYWHLDTVLKKVP